MALVFRLLAFSPFVFGLLKLEVKFHPFTPLMKIQLTLFSSGGTAMGCSVQGLRQMKEGQKPRTSGKVLPIPVLIAKGVTCILPSFKNIKQNKTKRGPNSYETICTGDRGPDWQEPDSMEEMLTQVWLKKRASVLEQSTDFWTCCELCTSSLCRSNMAVREKGWAARYDFYED